jgi:hypothetical protein
VELGRARQDGLELLGDHGQPQELARAGSQRAQDEVGRGVARGADDDGARALRGDALDELEAGLRRRAEGDDGSGGLEAHDLAE